MLRTDSPAAPTSLMFAGCLWHRWPHNHCRAPSGTWFDFQSLLLQWFTVHPWDWSQWFICGNMCSPPPHPPQIWAVVAWGAGVLTAAPAESRRDGVMAKENHQKVARGPLVIKAGRGTKSNGGRGRKRRWGGSRAADVIGTLFLLLPHQNSKYLKIETRSVLKMKW